MCGFSTVGGGGSAPQPPRCPESTVIPRNTGTDKNVPMARATDFSRPHVFSGPLRPSPDFPPSCPFLPRIETGSPSFQRQGLAAVFSEQHVESVPPGFPRGASWKCGEAARHLTPRYVGLNVFVTCCPAAPLYSHGAQILCRFKEIKLSSLPAAGE